MKIRSTLFIIAAQSCLILAGCSDSPSPDSPAKNDSVNTGKSDQTVFLNEEPVCFVSTNAEGHQFTIQLNFHGDSLHGVSDETVEWTGEQTTFSGIRKGDTLLVKSTFRDGPDGDFVTENISYLLQADKLYGKKDPSKNEYSLDFTKAECK